MKYGAWGILAIALLIAGGFAYIRIEYGTVAIPFKAPLLSGETSGASLSDFSVPQGFTLSLFARDVPGARVMLFDQTGALLVAETSKGKIVALSDTNGDGVADANIVVIEGLRSPHGMAFDCSTPDKPCDLYLAEENAVRRYSYDVESKKATVIEKVADLPSGSGHSTRTLLFMPSPNEHTLLISVGSSCNVCDESDGRRAKILAYDTRTKTTQEFARGLRNSVFMAIHPVTGAIWATENGRDGLGDDVPPDEINVIEKGKNYGWPICYGDNIHDTAFDTKTYIRNPCMAPLETPAKVALQAHSAPLGIAFIPEEGWPESWWHNAIVAYHGSWNRSSPTGYKLVRVPLDAQGNQTGEVEDFITGWFRADGKTIGRPVAVVVQPGGVMYLSDDQAGVIYRLTKLSR